MISDFISTGADWSPYRFLMKLQYTTEWSVGITVLSEFIKDQIVNVAANNSKGI
jgi:hypothetical protein